jgi:hypothetical protein
MINCSQPSASLENRFNLDERLDAANLAEHEAHNPVDHPYIQQILGAAVFDLSGLPEVYFISTQNSDISWVQAIFQSLGLQSLLLVSLKLESFRHATLHGAHYQAIAFKQPTGYTALLFQPHKPLSPEFIQWAQAFEPMLLKLDPRFSFV